MEDRSKRLGCRMSSVNRGFLFLAVNGKSRPRMIGKKDSLSANQNTLSCKSPSPPVMSRVASPKRLKRLSVWPLIHEWRIKKHGSKMERSRALVGPRRWGSLKNSRVRLGKMTLIKMSMRGSGVVLAVGWVCRVMRVLKIKLTWLD